MGREAYFLDAVASRRLRFDARKRCGPNGRRLGDRVTRSLRGARRLIALLGAFVLVIALPGIAFGDGTEMLGDPSIAIAGGSGVAAAGVGVVEPPIGTGQPGTINIDVPGSVVQVLVYWEGQNSDATYDDTINVDGNAVTGTLIGGPTRFFGGAWSSTLRADITGLGLVAPGPNALSIDGMDFTRRNNGAGVLVIYDDGTTSEIGLKDGNDLAFINFAPPLDSTVPQTFAFAPEGVDRVADLTIFASSIRFDDERGLRPSVIEVTLGNGDVTEFVNVLAGGDGNEWDTFVAPINIPAGVDALTVEVKSEDAAGTGVLEASLAWSAAALSVPVTPPDGGGEGCTPGYWKQEQHFDSWVGYAPGDSFDAVFGVDSSFATLLDGAEAKGGGENALARHAVAALLNASNPDVSYEYSEAEIIALVQGAYASGDFESAKDMLEYQNELGCPLD